MEGMTKRKDGGIQLKRMESGSLLAICAMCFSMSFLVMIPSSLLMAKKERNKESQNFISYFVMESQRQKAETHSRGLASCLAIVATFSVIEGKWLAAGDLSNVKTRLNKSNLVPPELTYVEEQEPITGIFYVQ